MKQGVVDVHNNKTPERRHWQVNAGCVESNKIRGTKSKLPRN